MHVLLLFSLFIVLPFNITAKRFDCVPIFLLMTISLTTKHLVNFLMNLFSLSLTSSIFHYNSKDIHAFSSTSILVCSWLFLFWLDCLMAIKSMVSFISLHSMCQLDLDFITFYYYFDNDWNWKKTCTVYNSFTNEYGIKSANHWHQRCIL